MEIAGGKHVHRRRAELSGIALREPYNAGNKPRATSPNIERRVDAAARKAIALGCPKLLLAKRRVRRSTRRGRWRHRPSGVGPAELSIEFFVLSSSGTQRRLLPLFYPSGW